MLKLDNPMTNPSQIISSCVPLLIMTLCLAKPSSGVAESHLAVPIDAVWRFATQNLDGVAWRSPGYDEGGWSNASPALFHVENAVLPAPKNSPLPERLGGGPLQTYYFRTSFVVTNAAEVVSLIFSNLIDDGAVFYLNGQEVQRLGVGAGVVNHSTLANRAVADATSFEVFSVSGASLTNLVSGTNVLAVSLHQQAATSSDAVFGCAVIVSDTVNLTRGPYLQIGSHTNITVRWRTDAASQGVVRFGTDVRALERRVDESSTGTEHEVNLTDLSPDTRYFYQIGTATRRIVGGDTNHFFVTAPLPGNDKPTRIWVLGDSGTATADQVAVRDAYETFTGARHTDLWLMLGDNAYNDGTDAEYQRAVFNIYTNMLHKSALWPALGNHDTAQATAFVDTYPYFDIFNLPKNAEAGGVPSGTEHYYSFDYANIHFICLDTMTASRSPSGAMYQWLTNDLANITADWTIAFFHHPPYSKGSHDSDAEAHLTEIREVFLPALERGGVDLVLSGHSHCYERSYLLDGHYGHSSTLQETMKLDGGSGRDDETGAYTKPNLGNEPNQGTVYVVAGSAGWATGGALNHPAMFVSLNHLGSLVLDVDDDRLDATFVREDATTNDTFTIVKLNHPPVAQSFKRNIRANQPARLRLRGYDADGDAVTFITNRPPDHGILRKLDPFTGSVTYRPARGFVGEDDFTFSLYDGQSFGAPAVVSLSVRSPRDRDCNGMPDDWEIRHRIGRHRDCAHTPGQNRRPDSHCVDCDPSGDPDGDGVPNFKEAVCNTDPHDAASALRISEIRRGSDGRCTLRWSSVGGVRYRVSYRDGDLVGAFTPLPRAAADEMDSNEDGVPGEKHFTTDPADGSERTRFYRIEIVQ